MNWFRKHLKHGSRLALFALAIQIALSFGHFHGAAPADVASHAQVEAASETAQQPQPSHHDPDQRAACAICAIISSTDSFVFATSPLLELPETVEPRYLTAKAEFAHLGPRHHAFRSRAPPAS
ncbi:DUF2946 family protein [Bradyrhizobium sp.]|uniref:DUF2946 family protein n=1 Tax=Bradyrhizobium sp. TaxID=376 RepID=UPI0025B9D40D|nr:DUF2946 family protein [Bradyrhizobium sp.]